MFAYIYCCITTYYHHRQQYQTFADMFLRILGMFDEKNWDKQYLKTRAIKERMKEAEDVIRQLRDAAVSGNYGDCTVQFPWEGREMELPPENEPPKNGDFDVRYWNQMLGAFFCHPTDSGGFIPPTCFGTKGKLPDWSFYRESRRRPITQCSVSLKDCLKTCFRTLNYRRSPRFI